MQVPTSQQVSAAMRHVYTAAGTTLTIGTLLAIVPQDSVQPALDALRQVGDGMQQVMGGVSKLSIIFGPIVMTWAGKTAFASAAFRNQLKSVFKSANDPANTEQKAEVLAATAAMPEVKTIVAPAIADAVPSEKVVAK